MSFFREFFPYTDDYAQVYLDSAATSQRLHDSLDAMQTYYLKNNANVHRGQYQSAQRATNHYEEARQEIASFLGAASSDNIIFTSGTTEAINLISSGLQIENIQGDTVLLCASEHHANLLPWQIFAKRHSLKVKVIKLDAKGAFTQASLDAALDTITDSVAIVAFAHVSNVLGNIYPIKAICEKASHCKALSIIDGTQAAAHLYIDVQDLQCDFYAISGHKMYAGTGIGALYAKAEHMPDLRPLKWGGEMVSSVTWDDFTLQSGPLKFEAGTPNIAGAIGMAKAARFIRQHLDNIQKHENAVYHHLLNRLDVFVEAGHVSLLGNIDNSISLISMSFSDFHHSDVARFLASKNIAVRAGHHCAMPLMQDLGLQGSLRVSIACYTSFEDIDAFIDALGLFLAKDVSQPVMQKLSAHKSDIENDLKKAKDWNAKHRLLLLHSKQLPLLALEYRHDKNRVDGCEAKVWLAKLDSSRMHGFSDSKVVRGIMALLLNKQAGLSTAEVQSFDFVNYLNDLGLSSYFSKGRRDGVMQMVTRIKELR